jgi:hypothetical protein
MPKVPQGQKRPADVVSNAVRVMRILMGEEDETSVRPGLTKAGAGRKVVRLGLRL